MDGRRKKYISGPVRGRAKIFDDVYDFYDRPMLRELTVYEQEPGYQDTGILDQYGDPVFAIFRPNSIGFVDFED